MRQRPAASVAARRGTRWALPVMVLLASCALAVASLVERSRSCERRGGVATRAGTRCDAPRAGYEQAAGAVGTLIFDPAIPHPSEVITATYTTGSPHLASTPRVVLRARVRSGEETLISQAGWVVELGALDAVGNGRFIGSFRLPAGVRYARMAVETADGAFVDANRGSLHELLTASEDGQVSYTSLVARALDHLVYDPAVLVETGRLLQRLDPSRPWGTYIRLEGESALIDSERQTQYREKSARMFRRFNSRLRRTDQVEAIDLGLMINWSRSDFDNEAMKYWLDRAMAEQPRSMPGIRARLERTRDIVAPQEKLDSLETIWADAPLPDVVIAAFALRAAERLEDTVLAARWLDRYDPDFPAQRAYMAERMALRGEYTDLVESQLHAWGEAFAAGGVILPVPGETRGEARRHELQALAETRASLGRLLLSQGRADEAALLLEATPDSALQSSTLLVRARVRRATGDETGAFDDLIRAAVKDEARTSLLADSAQTWFGADGLDTWRERVEIERGAEERAIANETAGAAIAEFAVTAPDGAARRVAEIAGGQVLVVAVLRAHALTGGALVTADAAAHSLAGAGVRWLWLDVDGREPISTPWHEQASIHRDSSGELLAVLDPRFIPQYYVIDGAGRIRYDTPDFRLLHTRAVALARQARQ